MYAKFCANREAANNFMRLFVNRRASQSRLSDPCRAVPFPITRQEIGRPGSLNPWMKAWCACN